MANVVEAIVSLKAKTAQFKRETQDALGDFRKQLQAIKPNFKALAVGAGAFAGATALIGKSAIDAAVQMEKMKAGLIAVMGSAAEAEKQFSRLQEVAKLPGLGLPEAVQGAVRLQVVGTSAEDAAKQLEAFGSAVARAGGGRAELARVVEQIAQMSAKSEVLMEDFRPIVSLMPDIVKAMDSAFGTRQIEQIREMGISSQEFIAGVTTALSELPPVGKTAANAIENFHDAVFQAKAALGEALLPTFTQILGKLSDLVDWFNNLSDTQKSIIAWTGAISGGLAGVTAAIAALGLALPGIIAGVTALGVALSFLAAHPIVMAITAAGLLGAAALALREKFKDAQIDADKLSQQLDNLAESSTKAQQIGQLASQIEYLRSKASLTTEEMDNLIQVQNKLADLSPTLVEGFDEQGNAIVKQKDAIVQYNAELQQRINLERELAIIQAKTRMPEIEKKYEKERKRLQEMEKLWREAKPGEPIAMESAVGRVLQKIMPGERKFVGKKWAGYEDFISMLKKQNEKVRELGDERRDLEAQIERAEQQYGIRVELPVPRIEEQPIEWTPQDYTAQVKERIDNISKTIDNVLREPVLTKTITPFVTVEDETAELTAKFNAERKRNYEEMLQGIRDAEKTAMAEREKVAKAAMEEEYDLAKRITEGMIQLDAKQYGEFQKSAEKWQSEQNKLQEETTDWFEKQTNLRAQLQTKIASKAYQTQLRDFSLFNKDVIAKQDKQVEEFKQMVDEMDSGWERFTKEARDNFGYLVSEIRSFLTVLPAEWQSGFDSMKESVLYLDRAFSKTATTVDKIGAGLSFWKLMIEGITFARTGWRKGEERFFEELKIERPEYKDLIEQLQREGKTTAETIDRIIPMERKVAERERKSAIQRRRGVRGLEPPGRLIRRGVPLEEAQRSLRQTGPAVQISAITGPTRDLLVSLLQPLRNLNILPSLMEAMTRAIYDLRDSFLGKEVAVAGVPAGGGMGDNITIENVNINVEKTADAGDIDALDRNLSKATRREKRLLGRRT